MLVLKGQTIDCRSLFHGEGEGYYQAAARPLLARKRVLRYTIFLLLLRWSIATFVFSLSIDVHAKCEYVALALSLLKVAKLVRFTKAKGHVIEHEISYRY